MALVTFGETPLRLSPPGHEQLRTAQEASIRADGTESNAAVAAAALDGDSVWVSKLPDTPLGRRVVSELEGHGIDTAIGWADEGRQGLTFHERGSDPRTSETVHDRSGTAVASVAPGDLPIDEVQDADTVFTSTSTAVLSETVADTTEAVFGAAQGSGVTTVTDIDYQPGLCSPADAREAFEGFAEKVDVLIANEDQARSVLDRSGQPRELVTTLSADYDLEMVVITRSELGAVVLHDTPGTNVVHEREAVEADLVDPAGQHAAFVGAFLQRLVDGAEAADALGHGVAAATLARTVPGPYLTVSHEEIDRVVDDVVEASR